MASVFNLSRVYRFVKDGAPQITDFPDDQPDGVNDLEVRMKHFTEIENFTFLGYVLAHECGGPEKPIASFTNLEVPDKKFQALVANAQTMQVSDEQVGDTLLDVGINWEHFVASNNNLMIPGNPLKVTDTVLQEQIDSLDLISEALVREVNLRAKARFHGK